MQTRWTMWTAVVMVATLAGCAGDGGSKPGQSAGDGFADRFEVDRKHFASTGRNDYFILEPGYEHVYESADGERLVITVLNETRPVDGVETRIVQEHESKNGKVIEVSRNFFAIDKSSGDVYYFGEEVDDYKDGKIVGHGGAWQSGVKGARYGLIMPARPRTGQKYYQEIAPGEAMDRAEVVDLTTKLDVPAGKFEKCLRTMETTPLEPKEKEYKIYAPGVGLLKDEDLKLVKHGPR